MRGFYEQCILPEPFTILGRDLVPFSFWHYILLRRNGVGFVLDEIVPYTLEDLTFSIFACSYTYEEATKLLYTKQFVPLSIEWGKQCSAANGGKDADMTTAALEFNRYIEVHTIRPKFKVIQKRDERLEKENEWYEDVLSDIQKAKGYTESQLLNYPFCRIYYEYLCTLKRGRIITFSDKASIFAERKAAYLKGVGK